MKVTGVTKQNGQKAYVIIHDGEIYIAEPIPSGKFACENVIGQLKEIKAMIAAGEMKRKVDATVEHEPDESQPTFKCVHPCALLIDSPIPLSVQCMETLDCYGWLDEHGKPDYERAARELKVHLESVRPSAEADEHSNMGLM